MLFNEGGAASSSSAAPLLFSQERQEARGKTEDGLDLEARHIVNNDRVNTNDVLQNVNGVTAEGVNQEMVQTKAGEVVELQTTEKVKETANETVNAAMNGSSSSSSCCYL